MIVASLLGRLARVMEDSKVYKRRKYDQKEESQLQRRDSINDGSSLTEGTHRRHEVLSQTRPFANKDRLSAETSCGFDPHKKTWGSLSPFSSANIALGLFFGFLTAVHWYPEAWLLLGLGGFVWIATFWLRRTI